MDGVEGATVMLEAWQRALQEVLKSAPELDIERIKAILTASAIVASWHVLIADEVADRACIKSAVGSSGLPINWSQAHPDRGGDPLLVPTLYR